MKETFSSTGLIERIKYQDYTILINPFKNLMICYVFKGKSYEAQFKINQIIRQLSESKFILERIEDNKFTTKPFSGQDLEEIISIIGSVFNNI